MDLLTFKQQLKVTIEQRGSPLVKIVLVSEKALQINLAQAHLPELQFILRLPVLGILLFPTLRVEFRC